jgi:hypothetical protein
MEGVKFIIIAFSTFILIILFIMLVNKLLNDNEE